MANCGSWVEEKKKEGGEGGKWAFYLKKSWFGHVKWPECSGEKGETSTPGCNKNKLNRFTTAQKRGQEGNETCLLHASSHITLPPPSHHQSVQLSPFVRLFWNQVLVHEQTSKDDWTFLRRKRIFPSTVRASEYVVNGQKEGQAACDKGKESLVFPSTL